MSRPVGTAVITGASAGLGATFARILAARGYGVILVARRRDRLRQLADEIRRDHAVPAEGWPIDLSDETQVTDLAARIAKMNDLTCLVNNAGFGTSGGFPTVEAARHVAMVRVHVEAPVRLCRAAVPGMVQRGGGSVINVSSVAGFVPVPGGATYSGTKSFLIRFSEALSAEVTPHGVRVQALCPGFTYTEFHDTPDFERFDRSSIPRMLWMSAEDVVERSLRVLAGGPVVFIPGVANRVMAFLGGRPALRGLLRRLARRARRV